MNNLYCLCFALLVFSCCQKEIQITNLSEIKVVYRQGQQNALQWNYGIALKDSGCGIDYGRNSYDFDDCVLIFTPPNQILTQ